MWLHLNNNISLLYFLSRLSFRKYSKVNTKEKNKGLAFENSARKLKVSLLSNELHGVQIDQSKHSMSFLKRKIKKFFINLLRTSDGQTTKPFLYLFKFYIIEYPYICNQQFSWFCHSCYKFWIEKQKDNSEVASKVNGSAFSW